MQAKAILALLGVVALLFALIGAYFYGRHDGAKINEAAWQKREAGINAQAGAEIAAADQRVLEAERVHASLLAKESAEYQQSLKENTDAKDRLIADLRAGNRKLSVPAACPAPGENTLSSAGPGTGGGDATARAELSQEASGFLVELAAEADEVVLQLTACQGIVIADRVGMTAPSQ